MYLKHRGTKVQIFLHKPELRTLAKAKELLEKIAILPCDQKDQATAIAAGLSKLAAALTRANILDGQQ